MHSPIRCMRIGEPVVLPDQLIGAVVLVDNESESFQLILEGHGQSYSLISQAVYYLNKS